MDRQRGSSENTDSATSGDWPFHVVWASQNGDKISRPLELAKNQRLVTEGSPCWKNTVGSSELIFAAKENL